MNYAVVPLGEGRMRCPIPQHGHRLKSWPEMSFRRIKTDVAAGALNVVPVSLWHSETRISLSRAAKMP